eukprot:3639647-Rhodomonas_salina.1
MRASVCTGSGSTRLQPTGNNQTCEPTKANATACPTLIQTFPASKYLRATEERPYFAGAFQALANCYEASGNYEAAIEAGWASVNALQAEVESPGIAGGTPKFLRGDTQPWPAYHKLVESMIKGGRPLPQIWDAMHQWRK